MSHVGEKRGIKLHIQVGQGGHVSRKIIPFRIKSFVDSGGHILPVIGMKPALARLICTWEEKDLCFCSAEGLARVGGQNLCSAFPNTILVAYTTFVLCSSEIPCFL
ncbi:hypothetical protein PanWU01x14_058300 [Parasponia andersonii]|uniref:Uncharacterized protein n=1 Tax=Parasponia andersonii TaxID=3476 RepID=A0A2P5DJ74_PARAD|nr:hypothetical protein PanWU01x14_058300 [Parasponia andersonii]